jgi:flagellar hook-associated protein FlgK
VGLRLFERYLENALDKIAGSCICTSAIPLKCAPLKCNPALEEEEEMKLSVESILADKFQRSKQKALERKAETKSKRAKEKKGAKTKGEKKAKEKKSIDTKKPPRAFAPVCAQVAHVKEPPTVEWGVKPSEDESDFSIAAKVLIAGEFLQNRVTRVISSEANDEDAGGKEVDGQGVGVFLQKKVDRFLSSETNGDAGEKEVEARMEGQEPSFPRDAVLSVTPVRMNKKKKVAEQRSDGRGNELNEVGPDDVSYDSFFEDIASRSGSDTDSDSDYTTEVVQVDFDPSKLSDTMDADKFLAREVLRRYAEMTGVSLDELIEEVVDGSMASITLDTFPMER